MLQGSSASLNKSGASSKGGKGPGSKAKDPIQERKEAQLADEAQVLCAHLLPASAHLPELAVLDHTMLCCSALFRSVCHQCNSLRLLCRTHSNLVIKLRGC